MFQDMHYMCKLRIQRTISSFRSLVYKGRGHTAVGPRPSLTLPCFLLRCSFSQKLGVKTLAQWPSLRSSFHRSCGWLDVTSQCENLEVLLRTSGGHCGGFLSGNLSGPCRSFSQKSWDLGGGFSQEISGVLAEVSLKKPLGPC